MLPRICIRRFRLTRILPFILFSFTACACGHTEAAPPGVPMATVMQTIRDYGRGHQVAPPADSDVSKIVDGDLYQAHIRVLLAQEKFDELEKSARAARANKSRTVGGVWVLYDFYTALDVPPAGDAAQDSDWVTILRR